MSLFSNLLSKVSAGVRRVGYGLGVIDAIDSGQRSVKIFRGCNDFKDKNRLEVLAYVHGQFNEAEEACEQLRELPNDELDSTDLYVKKFEYAPTVEKFSRVQNFMNVRKARNFAKHLEVTLTDYERGADYWEDTALIDEKGFIQRPALNHNVLIKTINSYAEKLKSVDSSGKYSAVYARAQELIRQKISK